MRTKPRGFSIGLAMALPVCLLLSAAAYAGAQPQSETSGAGSSAASYQTIDAPCAGTGEFQGTAALAINATGAIAGICMDSNGVLHGFLRSAKGQYTTIDAQGAGTGSGRGTIPTSINSAGTIAGTFIDASAVSHGFVRTATGQFTTFEAPGSETGECATQGGIGELFCNTLAGVIDPVLGVYGAYAGTDGVNRSFRRSPTGVFTAIDDPDAATSGMVAGTVAGGINASGAVVGIYADANSVLHGFLYTPASPPSTTSLTKGQHKIGAAYGGDGNFTASSGTVQVTVN